jgi:DNA-binding transcriptional ArsR family regulator
MGETKSIDASDRVFELAAELFSLLATPTRLRIVCQLCEGEKSVGELLGRLDVSQPNISQHLGTLYRAGVLGRRRAGSQVFYRLGSEHAQLLCEAVCAEQQRSAARHERTQPLQ